MLTDADRLLARLRNSRKCPRCGEWFLWEDYVEHAWWEDSRETFRGRLAD
jgi:hypothetical protein